MDTILYVNIKDVNTTAKLWNSQNKPKTTCRGFGINEEWISWLFELNIQELIL